MSTPIGSKGPSVPNIQTPATAPAEESKPVDIGADAKQHGITSDSNHEATTAAAQKQGKETTSVNQLKGDLQREELHGKLNTKPSNAEKAKTPSNAEKPKTEDPMSLYRKAIQESRAHKFIIQTLESQLKNAPDSEKPKIQKAIDLEKANLMDADRRREIYKKPAMEEYKLLEEYRKRSPLPQIRG